jgi:hypothetical protein
MADPNGTNQIGPNGNGPSGTGEADAAVKRLEAALERIAALAAKAPAHSSLDNELATPGDKVPEVTERLDALIAHLRQALDGGSA